MDDARHYSKTGAPPIGSATAQIFFGCPRTSTRPSRPAGGLDSSRRPLRGRAGRRKKNPLTGRGRNGLANGGTAGAGRRSERLPVGIRLLACTRRASLRDGCLLAFHGKRVDIVGGHGDLLQWM